ncbi:MAG: alpha/beta fold hydrolase [Chloroflexota bacterium]
MRRFVRVGLILFGLLLLVVAVGPFLIPIPPLQDTAPAEQLADPDSRFTGVDGLRVHYKTLGQGESALVLLHGFAASIFSWREVMAPLAETHTVIAFDRPAFGLTERPMPGDWQGESPYSPEAQVDLTIGLMDELGVERAILVGNSAGGTIAALTALRHPERVEALVLVDPAIYVGGGSPDWLRPILRTPQMRRIGPLFARAIRNWGEDFGRSAWHDPSRLTPEIWEGYKKPLQVENWDRALWEFTLASHSPNLEERLDELQMPVLVITGDDDRIVPTGQSVRLAGELPNAELVVIPDCGHVPHEECPESFLDAARAFLEGLP